MHKKIFILAFCLVVTAMCAAQRYAVIDSKYILEKLAEYKTSQSKLDQISNQWQQEIEEEDDDESRSDENN